MFSVIRCAEQFCGQVPQRLVGHKPLLKRNAKPRFSPVDDVLWQIFLSNAFYNLFGPKPTRLCSSLQSIGELDNAIVNKWYTRLYTGSHAHLVLAIQDRNQISPLVTH